MQTIISTAFHNELKRIIKKHKLKDSFQNTLIQSIVNAPFQDAILLRREDELAILKRRVANPANQRGKSHGFRIFYCLTSSEIHFCILVDVSDKEKELSTEQYIKIAKDRINA